MPEDWQDNRPLVPGVTIDSASTRDRDDAIWLMPRKNGHDIRISISDVGSFIPLDSAIAGYAEQRGETRYLRTNNIPMLPIGISEDKLSLLDTKETPVFSVNLSLDNNGEVTDVNLSRDRTNPYRMTYSDVDRFTKGHGNADEVQAFRRYEQFALNLLDQRRAKGAFAFFEQDKGIMTNEDGAITSFRSGIDHSGELIVQEFMILANTAIAEYMWRNGIPALYRNHNFQMQMSVEQVLQAAQSNSVEQLAILRQGFGKAQYATVATGHAALHLEAYAHWTSPLRRFADFVNHTNLIAYLNSTPFPYPADRLDTIAEHLNNVQDEVRAAKAVHFKDLDKALTIKQLGSSSVELDGLDPENFFKVVKLAGETGIASEELRSLIEDRINNNLLGSREITRLVFSKFVESETWQQINHAALQHVIANPSDAVTVFSQAQQSKLIRSVEFHIQSDAAGFSCTVTVKHNDGVEHTAQASAQSKKTAQQQAAIALVANMTGQVLELTAISTRQTPNQNDGLVLSTDIPNAKGLLQEYLQGHNLPAPNYVTREISMQGNTHNFEAQAYFKIGDQIFEFHGQATTKKGAEAAAAAAAVDGLSITQKHKEQPMTAHVISNNPISSLQERSQALQVPLPVYSFTQTGPSHNPTFVCTVTVTDGYGELKEFTVTAASKQQSKALASKYALEALQTK